MAMIGDSRLPTRFWDKVSLSQAGCWEWIGSRKPNGYGQVAWQQTVRYAHRVAYTVLVGPVSAGLVIDHLCRVRHCVNPEHLEPVTPRVNTLRGDTFAARHAAKTHCPAGHPYDEVNTYWFRDNKRFRNGARMCKECGRIRQRAKRQTT